MFILIVKLHNHISVVRRVALIGPYFSLTLFIRPRRLPLQGLTMVSSGKTGPAEIFDKKGNKQDSMSSRISVSYAVGMVSLIFVIVCWVTSCFVTNVCIRLTSPNMACFRAF